MNHKSRAQSISWFQQQYREGRLVLRPPFQRKPVWTDKQRSFLIESILLGIPVPEVYIQVTVDDEGVERFGVVDGQQRLRTILQFIGIESEEDRDIEDNNGFTLSELPQGAIFRNKSFANLEPTERRALYQYEICVRYLYEDNITVVQDVFKRLNKFSMPLKPQELRNATYHGAFARLAEHFADDDYWAVNRIVSPAAIRRMADIEMMSELLIGLIHGPQGGADKIITDYYDRYERYEDEFPEQPKIKNRFEAALELVQRLFPNISDAGRWSNRADFYSLFVALGTMTKEHTLPGREEKPLARALIEFSNNVDRRLERPTARVSNAERAYARAVEKGSNDKARRMDRHEALLEIIGGFFR